MAKCKVQGIDLALDRLSKEASRVAVKGAQAVTAGAQVYYDEMQRRIPRDTGETAKHMKIKKPQQTTDGWSCLITYEGQRSDGQRYGTIAFVNEYGTSSRAAQPFMRPSVEAKTGDAADAMKAELLKD